MCVRAYGYACMPAMHAWKKKREFLSRRIDWKQNNHFLSRFYISLTLIRKLKQLSTVNFVKKKTTLLVNSVSWINTSPSSHNVLANSAELIKQNENRGLLSFTECGIEANNKFLSQYRINYSRKTSQYDNLSHCINSL